MAQKRKIAQVEEPTHATRRSKTIKVEETAKTTMQKSQATRATVAKNTAKISSKGAKSAKAELEAAPQRKRKRETSEDNDDSIKNKENLDNGLSTPRAKRVRDILPPSPAETPSRKAAKLFDRLQLQSRVSPMKRLTAYNTPPDTPESLRYGLQEGVLPEEVRTLLDMQSAVLQALSARLALNSSQVRINVNELLKEASLIWQKRSLTLAELQRVLALDVDGIHVKLEDFGRAGICLVDDGLRDGIMIINTTKQRQSAETVLLQKWHAWLMSRIGKDDDPAAFLEQLPQASVHRSETIDKTSSIFAKGKQRLTDIRQCRAELEQATATQEQASRNAHVNAVNIKDRSASLLDRIAAKQAHLSSLPAGPTRAELEKKAALQKVEEIARVLDVLAAGRARASFSMQSIVQQLQQSLRTPISKQEAELALRLMAEEIMPRYVSVLCSGNMVGVVITKAGKLSFAEMKKRIADAA